MLLRLVHLLFLRKSQDSRYFLSVQLFFVPLLPPNQMNQNTAVGTSLFTALAIDRDISNAGVVRYSIDEVRNCLLLLFKFIRASFIIAFSKIHFAGYSEQWSESV